MKTNKTAISALVLCLSLGGLALSGAGCAGTRYQRSTGAYLDDKGVTARVKTALFRDPMVSGFQVHVKTYRGDVQLSGFVDTPEQKERAALIAQETSGVRSVANDLDVKPAPLAVGSTGATVENYSGTVTEPEPIVKDRALDRDRDLDRQRDLDRDRTLNAVPANPPPRVERTYIPKNIEINAVNGRATIRGTVFSEDEKRSIARKLREVPGITSVDNELEVHNPDR